MIGNNKGTPDVLIWTNTREFYPDPQILSFACVERD